MEGVHGIHMPPKIKLLAIILKIKEVVFGKLFNTIKNSVITFFCTAKLQIWEITKIFTRNKYFCYTGKL